ncbi:RluA family pseudouridine synthase [Chitinibacteraceae bacterium HSL-7]
MTFVEIGDEEAGQRLDNFLLRQLKGVPKSHIYRLIRSGEVRVNKGRADAQQRLAGGDVVRIPPVRVAEKPPAAPAEAASHRIELPVIFEDEGLLVVNKPAGIAVHGGSGVSFGVIELLRAQRPQARFLELAHRLDRETSGLLIVAKKRSMLLAINTLLREGHQIDKRYLTLAKGSWKDDKRHLRYKLFKYTQANGERRVRVQEDGQDAHTIVYRRRNWQDCTLLECEIKTGRTHQIRVHLATAGFPILGDDKYGDFDLNKALVRDGLKRMFLHAWRLKFRHPVSGVLLELEAPLPPELARFTDQLKD